ncbi:hypothetical protein OEA41_001436 [Lepraria neglecta]|uniref:Heme oxygenase-like protein n=1 Tax=Lepraria neglecta TaxID=209136 RepID=A0AAD9ZD65_9LECA|nr:hypothetical protein OEA41_001436 [Lepraria neglecta]
MHDSQTSYPSPTPTPSLSQRINIATRPSHTHLNALILSLLPLGLPRHATDPTLYAKGLQHVLPIYEAFEGAFRLLSLRCENEDGGQGLPLVEAMSALYVQKLERVERLRRDIEKILGTNHHFSEERARLDAFTTHMNTSIASKPHLLLAYTWLLYMALFSGGRYIRVKLRQAGSGFWTGSGGEKGTDMDDYLSFWTFDGQEDGEDIKTEFKRRFAGVEAYLTDEECEDVVQEAVYIMQSMLEVVGEIAETVGTRQAGLAIGQYGEIGRGEKSTVEVAEADEPSMRWLFLKHVLPMGMAELIAGASRAVTTGI